MNSTDKKYCDFALVKEMLETANVIRNFERTDVAAVVEKIKKAGKLFLTGEGSSRIFPAKNAIRYAMNKGLNINIATEGSFQAAEYDLKDFVVFGASNSGQTKEIICLIDNLKKQGNNNVFGLTAKENTPLSKYAAETFVLTCGWEKAVAATKSVIEQALFYQAILAKLIGEDVGDMNALADACQKAMTDKVDPEIIKHIAGAQTIYFAGRNDGVAEELTLKTNEITRKKSDYLEGTYLMHGVEEVMHETDVVIWIDPFESEMDLIQKNLVDNIGVKVIAISTKDTIFPTIKIAGVGQLSPFVQLAAGWNLLVDIGTSLGINLDKTERARKVGNEFEG